jgi:heat shock protein 4
LYSANIRQEWLYDDGDDASKAQYVSKKEDIRSIAGPIIQRYNDKIQGEQQAAMEKHQKEHASKQAELERAKREAESKKQAEAPPTEDAKDTEMTDAEAQKPDGVEEAS